MILLLKIIYYLCYVINHYNDGYTGRNRKIP